MSNTQFVSSTNAVVAPNTTQVTVAFLAHPDVECKEAWVLGRASQSGVLEVQLLDQAGRPLSDVSQLFGAGDVSRTKMLNVRIPASDRPPVVKVQAKNAADDGDALVEGVLLIC